jgi:hypothetical protein
MRKSYLTGIFDAILAFTASACKASGMDTIQTPLHAARAHSTVEARPIARWREEKPCGKPCGSG